ncbi:MAG: hypothetical protein RL139_1294 [Gemmatimonadota bacterium]|jgi:hypothetical protein
MADAMKRPKLASLLEAPDAEDEASASEDESGDDEGNGSDATIGAALREALDGGSDADLGAALRMAVKACRY